MTMRGRIAFPPASKVAAEFEVMAKHLGREIWRSNYGGNLAMSGRRELS